MNPEPVLMRFRACRCMRGLMRFRACRCMMGLMTFKPCRYMRGILVDNKLLSNVLLLKVFIVEYYMSCYERCVCCTGVISENQSGNIEKLVKLVLRQVEIENRLETEN